ncbi:hypothetical protein LCGC14_0467570 [marine sediment metagenome]|uniref:GspL periplasmic domain-containing protein n=1 Tax=marine sediment metagenome TaxID=412755 RepID=A0A0F9SW39_9ZZZZ|nr:hypothetical protein [Phycisphaerae bacterium]HDZ45298.1 hypothetical protein [Phycisphaerae bacterium]
MSRKMLGLAVAERSMIAVEVVAVGGQYRAVRAATFVYPDQASLDSPAQLGKAIKQFLRAEGFSARRCVIGLEAKWLMAREKLIPPGSDDSLVGILSIQAEREFTSDYAELVLDYVGPIDTHQGRQVLLVAASGQHVQQLRALAAEAGLKPAAITATTMALADSSDPADTDDYLLLHLTPDGAELAVRSGGSVRLLRRLSVAIAQDDSSDAAGSWMNDLAGQLRRVISLLPDPPDAEGKRQLHVWNRAGLDEESLDALAEQISAKAKLCESSADVDLAGVSGIATADAAVAACLGAAGLRGQRLGVDFLHAKLAAPTQRAVGKRSIQIAAGLVAAVVICILLLLHWTRTQHEVDALAKQITKMAPSVSKTQDIVERIRFARPWHDRQPTYLDCLRDLTMTFPIEGIIWTTSLTIQEDMQMVFSGKAVNEEAVLDVLDKLKDSPAFSQVRQMYLREAGKGQSEIAFAIAAHYSGPITK